jgi:hypothetical protein
VVVMMMMVVMMVVMMMVVMVMSRESGDRAESHRQCDDGGEGDGLEHGGSFLWKRLAAIRAAPSWMSSGR